jgi:hypothetical protein
MPAQNARSPLPVSTTQRQADGFVLMRANKSTISAHLDVDGLRTSGRLKRMTGTSGAGRAS